MAKKHDKALYAAIYNGDAAAAKLALAAGASPDAVDDGFPCLWVAASSIRLTKLLLTSGANPNVLTRGDGGQTPLGAAIERKKLAVIEALLAAGADPNLYRGLQNPPLADAARIGNAKIVKVLVAAGARDLPCVNGQRGRDFATPKIAKLLPKPKKRK
ncbi:MAG: ankyrin repeat domain-containing protein [Kofleriaceae bacterium]